MALPAPKRSRGARRANVQGVHRDDHYGDVNLVSGVPWPVVEVKATWARFRLLNAAVARPYLLHFKDAAKESNNNIGPNNCWVSAQRRSGGACAFVRGEARLASHASRGCVHAQVTASDGGFRGTAVAFPPGGLFMAPAERYEVRGR